MEIEEEKEKSGKESLVEKKDDVINNENQTVEGKEGNKDELP